VSCPPFFSYGTYLRKLKTPGGIDYLYYETSEMQNFEVFSSVPELDPDPYVFGPPGCESFHQRAKNCRKTLIYTVLGLLYDFLSLKNDVNVPSKRISIKT
jgi:hypothetical protein